MGTSPTRGRSEYRDNAILRCPACGAVMLAQAIEQAYRTVTGKRWGGYYSGWPEKSADRLGGVDATRRPPP